MKYNKGFAPVLIALIVTGVLAAGGGIYYLAKNSETIISDNNGLKYEEKNTPIPKYRRE